MLQSRWTENENQWSLKKSKTLVLGVNRLEKEGEINSSKLGSCTNITLTIENITIKLESPTI